MDNIITLLSGLGFHQALWLLPAVVILHVLEELPRFPQWAGTALKMPYTRAKFVVENIVLFALLMVSLTLTLIFPASALPGLVGLVLVLSAAVSLFQNAVFHGVATLKSGVYSPGTVTACLFFPGVSTLIFALAASEGLLSIPIVILAAVLGTVMLPLVVTIVHKVIDMRIPPKRWIKLALMGLAPAALVPLAMLVFDPEVVQKVMVYAGPIALLPLVLKWAVRWKRGEEASK